jgi:pyruvate dehydrogenase E1 component alpha subunit
VTALAQAIERVQAADALLNQCAPTPFPLPIRGLEAVVAGTVSALERGDWWVPGLRERAGAVLRDTPADRLVDGTAGARPYKLAPPDTAPALRALVGVGLALATPDRCTAVHLGIGSTADGAFHEALNIGALRQANLVLVVAVHPLTGDAPVGPQLATTPSKLAKAFGWKTRVVDGNSAKDVFAAVSAARKKGGPHLIEANLTPGEDLLERARAEA